jgi:hypothetical protein
MVIAEERRERRRSSSSSTSTPSQHCQHQEHQEQKQEQHQSSTQEQHQEQQQEQQDRTNNFNHSDLAGLKPAVEEKERDSKGCRWCSIKHRINMDRKNYHLVLNDHHQDNQYNQ